MPLCEFWSKVAFRSAKVADCSQLYITQSVSQLPNLKLRNPELNESHEWNPSEKQV
jgi:hypothetical protein